MWVASRWKRRRLNFFRKTPRHLSIYFQKEVNSRGFIWREGVSIVEDSEELGTVFLQVGGPSYFLFIQNNPNDPLQHRQGQKHIFRAEWSHVCKTKMDRRSQPQISRTHWQSSRLSCTHNKPLSEHSWSQTIEHWVSSLQKNEKGKNKRQCQIRVRFESGVKKKFLAALNQLLTSFFQFHDLPWSHSFQKRYIYAARWLGRW